MADTQGGVLPTLAETFGYKGASFEWIVQPLGNLS